MKKHLLHIAVYILIPIYCFIFICSTGAELKAGDLDSDASRDRIFPRQRGVCWVAMPYPVTESDFLPLIKNNIEWINQTPFGFQKDIHSPEIRFFTDDYVWWGERDVGIETTTMIAKKLGLKSVLKPHLWIHRPPEGKWRAEIAMKNEADWQRWFEQYRRFILHFAALAQKTGIDVFCIGTELHTTIKERDKDWRHLIAEVRKVYHGKLTYAANWYQEFEDVGFWDELDFIGIQAYFPLTDKINPSVEDLKRGWEPYSKKIENVQRKFNKPVIFTEIGYKSARNAAIRPWEWKNDSSEQQDRAALLTQANCYEAFFQSFWNKDWFAGVYFWKWFPNLENVPHYEELDFTPQNRPAEDILAKWFGKL